VLAGLDNFQVCSGLGLLPLGRSQRHYLAAAFLICEAGMALVGFTAAKSLLALFRPSAAMLAPLLTLLCGAVVLVSSLREGPENPPAISRFVYGLPLALSSDNLFACAAAGIWSSGALAVSLGIGAVSGMLSALGLYGAGWLRQHLPLWITSRADALAGSYLCLLALRMFLVNRT
jgi:putative Mn2+ efflux pump MntP